MQEREGKVEVKGQKPEPVVIIDNGEDYENGEGRIPNHDKVEIIYKGKQITPIT